jgi:hypothetical protein
LAALLWQKSLGRKEYVVMLWMAPSASYSQLPAELDMSKAPSFEIADQPDEQLHVTLLRVKCSIGASKVEGKAAMLQPCHQRYAE